MEILLGVITGLIILVLLVVVHELGHAIVARRNGVVVEEFGIGFPPKALGKRIKNSILGKNVLLTLNWLPLGGFVKLQGEHDAARGKGDYGAATFWQKTKILLAGVLMNWVVAAVLLTILALVGMPKIIPNQFTMPGDSTVISGPVQVTKLVEGGAAASAGFVAGDEITAINGDRIENSQAFIDTTRALKGERIAVTYDREGESRTASVVLGNDITAGVFGAGIGQREETRSTWSAPIVGVVTTGQLSWATLEGLGQMIGKLAQGSVLQFSGDETTRTEAKNTLNEVSESVAGPIGILGVLFPSAQQQGLTQLLLLTAIISLTLAVMNTLPIPALDGGRWFTMALFRLLKKPLTKEREETIQGAGFLVLMGLIVLITIADIGKLW